VGSTSGTTKIKAAIREGLAQLDREEWVDEEDMKVLEALWHYPINSGLRAGTQAS
jgi:hypothetical protein